MRKRGPCQARPDSIAALPAGHMIWIKAGAPRPAHPWRFRGVGAKDLVTKGGVTMNGLLRSLRVTWLFFALAFPGAAVAVELDASSPLVKGCESCHGPRGDSRNTDVPRLNGQQGDYILARLKAFLDPARKVPHGNQMTWTSPISDEDAAALARYFSRQAPPRRAGSGALADAGAEIFRHGAKPAMPACAVCHGQDGQGIGTTPRIAGQHGDYLTRQLRSFMSNRRASDPMNRHTWDMTLRQASALSAYLAND